MADEPEKSPWYVPGVFKIFTDWHKLLGLIALFAGVPAAYLWGQETGHVAGWISAAGFLIAYVVYVLLAQTGHWLRAAGQALEKTEYIKVEDRRAISKGLKNWHLVNTLALLTLVLLVLVAASALGWPYADRWRTTKAPEVIHFDDIAYLDPTATLPLLREAPFLESVLTALKDEGNAEQQKFKLFLGTTPVFSHPTPEFRCEITVSGGNYQVSGYAFRKTPVGNRWIYQPLSVAYVRNEKAEIIVTPCEKKDVVFLVCRLTALPGSDLPDDLKATVALKVVTDPK